VDADSTNGTEVNHRRLVPNHSHLLLNRDRIRFGPNIHVMYLTAAGFFEMLQQFHRAGII
jgi:pSer/pThr/pTyr-binding forkhead associated (FHA) protein